jgi:hypothetical protein
MGKRLQLKAFDQDVGSTDSLGKAEAVTLLSLVDSEQEKSHALSLNDASGKPVGQVKLTTRLVWHPPEPEFNFDLNKNCILRLWISECKLT